MAERAGPLYRIAHTEASLGWGGQEIRVLSEARGFRARGHDVVLYAAAGSRILSHAPRYGIPAVALPVDQKRPRGVMAMVGAFGAHPVDVVNTHSSTDSWLAALACRWLRTRNRPYPVVVRTRHVAIPVPNNRATRWLYRRATTRIVTTGEALREQLVRDNRIDPARIDSVPTGIDPSAFGRITRAEARKSLGLPGGTPLVGIVATLRSWKGHRFLVDAMPLLRDRDAQLVIIGDGPQRDALHAQVAHLGLGDRVTFAGQQEDVAPWLAALDVFVLPSYANEGVPQALLQAMFAGIPCVTTAIGAIGEIARDGETAVIVETQDPRAIAAGVDEVLRSKDWAAGLAARARDFAATRYTIDTMLDRMDAVFRRALADAKR